MSASEFLPANIPVPETFGRSSSDTAPSFPGNSPDLTEQAAEHHSVTSPSRRRSVRDEPPFLMHQHSRSLDSRSFGSRSFAPSYDARPRRYGHGHSGYNDYNHGHNGVVSDEPYIPVDPFQSRPPLPSPKSSDSRLEHAHALGVGTIPLPVSTRPTTSRFSATRQFIRTLSHFLIDVVPRQLYLHLLLRIPALYFSRVTRVFEDAELSMPDIKDMVNAVDTDVFQPNWYTHAPNHHHGTQISPALARFRHSWDDFVGSLMSEWQSQNILAVLLLSAVLTMLQIQNVEGDPIMRTAALLSLVCALMSLLYGCIYIPRFGTMNKMYKAASWAEEARQTRTLIWWNVWVFLAMPAIWLAWSIIFFIVCVLSFIWRTGSTVDAVNPIALLPHQALGPRIAVSGVFALGCLYFVMIMKTLKRYGSTMDREWRERANTWRNESLPHTITVPRPSYYSRSVSSKSTSSMDGHQSAAFVPGPYRVAIQDDIFLSSRFNYPPIVVPDPIRKRIETLKIMDLNNPPEDRRPLRPEVHYHITDDTWNRFIEDLNLAWDGNFDVPNLAPEARLGMRSLVVVDLVDTWNTAFFFIRGLEVVFSADPILNAGADRPDSLLPSSSVYLARTTIVTHGGWTDPHIRCPSPSSAANIPSHANPSGPSAGLGTSPQIGVISVPGPYRKALEHHGSYPDAFSRPANPTGPPSHSANLRSYGIYFPGIPLVPDIDHEDWIQFMADLRLAWTKPIAPNMTPSACLELRSVIIADFLDTWNKEFFLSRGVEVVLSPDPAPTTAEMEFGAQSGVNDRGYPPSPVVIYLNQALLGLDDGADYGTLYNPHPDGSPLPSLPDHLNTGEQVRADNQRAVYFGINLDSNIMRVSDNGDEAP